MKRTDVELMAPVGSYESLMAAIQGGANSVYFGIEKLNMRARSSNNFTIDDLKKIVGICRENNIKAYLTINTIIYDAEIDQMKKIVDTAKESGISAIIATDHAVLSYAKQQGIEIHISTQVNISNLEAVKFYSNYADVMVLARELSLDQIGYIVEDIKNEKITGPSGNLIKVELFIHGALCMAISGKCYLSLHEYNYSANRGSCFQVCRKGYRVIEKEEKHELDIDNEYIMSPKDLCTLPFLDKLLDKGISVLKIEGRARGPEYVKTVCQIYNSAIKAYCSNEFTTKKARTWEKELASVFNRGFWGGYYLGKRLGEWSKVYGSNATKRKIYIGKGSNYFNKIKVAEFKIETGELHVGDEILITGPTTGVIQTIIEEIRVNHKKVLVTKKGDACSIPLNEMIRRSDKLYKMVDVTKELMQ